MVFRKQEIFEFRKHFFDIIGAEKDCSKQPAGWSEASQFTKLTGWWYEEIQISVFRSETELTEFTEWGVVGRKADFECWILDGSGIFRALVFSKKKLPWQVRGAVVEDRCVRMARIRRARIDRICVIMLRQSSRIRSDIRWTWKFFWFFLLRICWCDCACHRDIASVAIYPTFSRPWLERWHAVQERWNAVTSQTRMGKPAYVKITFYSYGYFYKNFERIQALNSRKICSRASRELNVNN